jgi:hypothetical protein
MKDLWALLDEQGVDIVLTGHEHSYQRWKPLNGAGELDPGGITQFVIGTGGHGIQSLARTDSRVAASDATKGDYGALRLELNPGDASFQYITTLGQKDSGVIACDEAANTTTPTLEPTATAHQSPTPSPRLFSDGFESGTMAQWTSVTGPLTLQRTDVASGAWAARATSLNASGTTTVAYASKTLAASQTDMYYQMR